MKLPAFVLPPLAARIGARLPTLPPTLALVAALNVALGRVLPREPIEPLAGRRLRITVRDAGLRIGFTYDGRRFRPDFDAAAPDLAISANLRDFLALMLREEDPDSLFFDRRLVMEGDTELGLLVKNTLDAIDPDSLAGPLRALLAGLRPQPRAGF